jgi:hypothetical protein
MSKQLIESILSGNMLEANDMVEAKMAEIRERKMYEMKRMYAARMDEIFGALTKADIAARKKAGYKKASEILGDPREKERKSPRINPGAKILKKKVSEGVVDDVTRAVKRGVKRTKTRINVMRHVPGAMKDIAAQGAKEAGKSAYHAALKGISDPLDTAAKVTTGAVKGTVKGVKKGLGAVAKSRLGQKIAAHEPEAPGSKVLRAAKRFADSPITQDVKSIAFRNL